MQAALNYCIKYKGLVATPLVVDGDFGAASAAATTAFQNKYGLAADGWFGSGTIAKMKEVLGLSTTTQTCKITLNSQGATIVGATSVTATYGKAMPTIYNLPQKPCYTFGGYYDGTGGTGTQYYTATGKSARTWNKKDATATLYAKWIIDTSAVTPTTSETTTADRYLYWEDILYDNVKARLNATSLPTNESQRKVVIDKIIYEEAGKLQSEFRTLYCGSLFFTKEHKTLAPLYENFKNPDESTWNGIVFGGLGTGFKVGLLYSIFDAGNSGMGSGGSYRTAISGLGAKNSSYLSRRGWTLDSINEVYSNPYTTRTAFDKATGQSATAYYNRAGDYVVVNDITNELVQLSEYGNAAWIPDSTIINPYKP